MIWLGSLNSKWAKRGAASPARRDRPPNQDRVRCRPQHVAPTPGERSEGFLQDRGSSWGGAQERVADTADHSSTSVLVRANTAALACKGNNWTLPHQSTFLALCQAHGINPDSIPD